MALQWPTLGGAGVERPLQGPLSSPYLSLPLPSPPSLTGGASHLCPWLCLAPAAQASLPPPPPRILSVLPPVSGIHLVTFTPSNPAGLGGQVL